MYHPENPSTLSFELKLGFILEMIQQGVDVEKEEVWLGVEGYWEAVRTHNEECRQMMWHNASQEASLVMGKLKVYWGLEFCLEF